MEFRILGPLAVVHGGRRIDLGGGKPRSLLALLLLHANQVVSTDRIIDALWGEAPPDGALNTVQVHVSRLRKALASAGGGSRIVTRAPGYLLRVEPGEIDAERYEELVRRGRMALDGGRPALAAVLLREADALWRGDVLADLVDASFADGARRRLEEVRWSALEALLEAELAAGRPTLVVAEAERLVAAHPLREGFWTALAAALARSGRQAEALRAFGRAAAAFAEVGLEPGVRLRELEDAVLREDPSVSGDARSSPSVDIEVAAVEELLRAVDDAPVLVEVTGRSERARAAYLESVRAHLRERMPEFAVSVVRSTPEDTSDPGALLRRLEETAGRTSGVVLVDGLHHADATSLARLPGLPVSLVTAYAAEPGGEAPERPELRRALDELRRRAAESVRIDLDRLSPTGASTDREAAVAPEPDAPKPDGSPSEAPPVGTMPDADPRAETLVAVTALAREPLPVDVAARVLGADPSTVLDLGRALVGSGRLAEDRRGFVLGPDADAADIVAGLGEVRLGHLAARLADGYVDRGVHDRERRLVGRLYLEAGLPDRAATFLAPAALDLAARGALLEALPVLEDAIAAMDAVDGADPNERAQLHIARAQALYLAGRADEAIEEIDQANRFASGETKVAALGWHGQIADGLQRPQQAEVPVALGQQIAREMGRLDMAGSLLSFHGRLLSRLGFPDDADAAVDKALRMLETHGRADQRWRAANNRAWILFDRGRAREAEAAFAALRDGTEAGTEQEADVAAWWARAAFASGRPSEALAAADAAVASGRRLGALGPVYVGHLALVEGMLWYGQGEDAVRLADDLLDIVLRSFGAWENVARSLRARALWASGDLDAARTEAAAALEATPDGANGWRWRVRIEALVHRLDAAAGEPWDAERVADLVEELLEGRWFLPAIELLIERARREDLRAAGEQAASLANQLGLPTLLIAAVEAADLWETPAAVAARRAAVELDRAIPDPWRAGWLELPGVARALELGTPADEEYVAAVADLDRRLVDALRAAGLHDPETLLSPAQRRASGLRFTPPRRRSRLALVAGIAAALVLAGGIGGAVVATLTPEPVAAPPQTIVVEASTTTTIPPLEARILPTPEERIVGQWAYLGGPLRQGAGDRLGVPFAEGIWWERETGGPVTASPVVEGTAVVVGSADGNVYFFDTTTGAPTGPGVYRTDGPIEGAAWVGLLDTGDGRVSLSIVGSRDGHVYAISTRGGNRPLAWRSEPVGEVVSSPLVVDGSIAVVTSLDGFVYGLDVTDGSVAWRFPASADDPDHPPSPMRTSPAADGATVYVGREDGRFYALDGLTGTPICMNDTANDALSATPVVADGVVYAGSRDTTIHMLDARNCNWQGLIRMDSEMIASPAIADGVMYVPSERVMLAIDPATSSDVWSMGVLTGGKIASSPSVSNGIVYFGSDDGFLYAVAAADGTVLWTFEVGTPVAASPAIADGAVYVGSGDGRVIAIGCEDAPDCS